MGMAGHTRLISGHGKQRTTLELARFFYRWHQIAGGGAADVTASEPADVTPCGTSIRVYPQTIIVSSCFVGVTWRDST